MAAHDEGIFFLVAGPTAAGKTTVLKKLVEVVQGLRKDISVTTRPPRENEVDGRDYHFWTQDKFLEEEARGAFLETAVVHGRFRYGTLKKYVSEQLELGVDVIKDIDVQGVEKVRAQWPFPKSVAIFLSPPSPEELVTRLKTRGSEDAEGLKRRLVTAREEVQRIGEYDYLVVNDSVDAAVSRMVAILEAEHLRRDRNEISFCTQWDVKI